MTKRVALYCRTSTTDHQTTENQRLQLQAIANKSGWEIVAIYDDSGISGTKGRNDRPAYDALLKGIARREFELVMAWSVDRLGRSLPDLIGFLEDLQAANIDLYLHQQGLDTSTPTGKMMFQMLGIFAEFERSMIVSRVKSALDRCRAKGIKLDRPQMPEQRRHGTSSNVHSERRWLEQPLDE
jgi:DNA invertase Pin-like site-specific DNA recombinase